MIIWTRSGIVWLEGWNHIGTEASGMILLPILKTAIRDTLNIILHVYHTLYLFKIVGLSSPIADYEVEKDNFLCDNNPLRRHHKSVNQKLDHQPIKINRLHGSKCNYIYKLMMCH